MPEFINIFIIFLTGIITSNPMCWKPFLCLNGLDWHLIVVIYWTTSALIVADISEVVLRILPLYFPNPIPDRHYECLTNKSPEICTEVDIFKINWIR